MQVRSLLFVALVGAALVGASHVAHAGELTIGDTQHRIGNGGEFRVTGFDDYIAPIASVVNALDEGNFNTFCMEYNENIVLEGTYLYDIDTVAVRGGVSGGNPDPLSRFTAKLYYVFWTDQWGVSTVANGFSAAVDYDYSGAANNSGTHRDTDGSALQQALWYLEGEREWSQINAQAKAYVNFAKDDSLTWALLGHSEWEDNSEDDIGAVRVLNLYNMVNGTRVEAQSQLVVVPLPASIWMGLSLLAMLGLGARIRHRRRAHGLV